jgi:small subunit ribosomal protein S13
MPRIQGVDIPNDKPVYISLTYLYGIGRASAINICYTLGLDLQAKARDLSEDDITRIAHLLEKDYLTEGQLRRKVQQDIARLRDIGCYRGLRHRRGLPARGQRTKTNARTRKGIRKTVAGKKGVKDR